MSRSDPLAEYNKKRDFKRTAEPAGKRAAVHGEGGRFIVQKHDASRLHWDLRLEADGVLKSWAVTKGPSPDPEIKRLAVRTEDHPMGYADFEGIIPAGEYGGGTGMLWDRGSWAPVPGKSWKDIDKGHLHFTLDGERMKGEWLLIRLKGKPGEKRENWLLRKLQDEYAEEGDPLVQRCLTSVNLSPRTPFNEYSPCLSPAISAIERPVSTEVRHRCTSGSPSSAYSSCSFLSSQFSRFSPGLPLRRISSHSPFIRSPSSVKCRCPLSMSFQLLPGTGAQVPRSHSIPVPPPYSPAGMIPSKSA